MAVKPLSCCDFKAAESFSLASEAHMNLSSFSIPGHLSLWPTSLGGQGLCWDVEVCWAAGWALAGGA